MKSVTNFYHVLWITNYPRLRTIDFNQWFCTGGSRHTFLLLKLTLGRQIFKSCCLGEDGFNCTLDNQQIVTKLYLMTNLNLFSNKIQFMYWDAAWRLKNIAINKDRDIQLQSIPSTPFPLILGGKNTHFSKK